MTRPASDLAVFARGAALSCLSLALSPMSPSTARADDGGASALIFGSMEAGPAAFVTGGTKLAVDRIDREGFVALASAGAGARSERRSSGATLTRRTLLGAGVFGYQWVRDWGVVALYAGPEGSIEALSGAGGVAILPARFGARLHGELWARPSEDALLTATAILGSARASVWTRASWGWRLWGAYLGPEASLYADETGYTKWGVGLHATNVSFGKLSFRASAGYLLESSQRSGSPYVAVSIWSSL